MGIHLGAALRDAAGLDPNLARARDLRSAFYVGVVEGLNLTAEWVPPPPLNWCCPTCAARNALDLFLCACGQTRGIPDSLLLHPPRAPAAAVSPLAVPTVGAAGVFDFGAEGEWPVPRAP